MYSVSRVKCGRRERLEELHRLASVFEGHHEVGADRLQIGRVGNPGEPVHHHRDRVHVPSGQTRAGVVGRLLHPQRAQDHVLVGLHEREHAPDPEVVGSGEEVGVQHVALDELRVKHELAQEHGLLGRRDLERGLGGAQAGRRVPHRADAADAAGDLGQFVPAPSVEHGLEEAGRLDDVEGGPLQNAVLDVDAEVSVPFDAGQVLEIEFEVDGVTHRRPPSGAASPRHWPPPGIR